MARPRLLVIAMMTLAVLSSCTRGSDPAPPSSERYVAIGDSFVSGPGIADEDPESGTCVRSNHNYPTLVAKALDDGDFVDVSCGGATTGTARDGRVDATGEQIPSQLDALTPDTKLVTVGIGGNDGGLTSGLFVHCLVKTSATDAACAKFTEDYLPTVYGATRDRVAAILTNVKELAPKARVLLVGYLRIVPDAGDCPLLQMTEANRAKGMEVELGLTKLLREAAKAADVEFVDVRGISKGHDVCAGKDAWVNGTVNVPNDGYLLHPNKAGMQAVARQVLKAVNAA